MIDRYWSAVAILQNNDVPTVEATSEAVPFTKRNTNRIKSCNCPVAVSAPPKVCAQMISQIVGIMPDIPLVCTNSFSTLLPVSISVLP